jgi:hypothetical protein
MLPKQINEDIKTLNEKVSELSVKRNSFTTYQKKIFVDEIKESTFSVNRMLDNLSDAMSKIVLSSPYSNFEVREWFESLKEKVAFSEPNPRLIYEEQQREIEKQLELERRRKIEIEIDKTRRAKIEEEKAKRDKEIQLELERRRKIEIEIAEARRAKIEEEILRVNQRKELKSIYYNGPENREKIQQFIDSGYDISDSIFPLSRMIERGRTMEFIQFLIQKGLKLNYPDILAFQKAGFFNSQEFLNSICNSENFNDKRIKSFLVVKQEAIKKKMIDEFMHLCLNGPNDIRRLKKYLENDFKISQNVLKLGDLVLSGRDTEFISLLIDAGLRVNYEDFRILLTKGFLKSQSLVETILQSKNIDSSLIKILQKHNNEHENN